MCIPTAAFLALALLPQAAAASNAPAAVPGTIAVEISDDAPQSERVFTDAVTRALFDANFVPLPRQSHSRYLARVKVTRTARGLGRADAKEAAPMAALGQVYVTLPSGKSQIRGLVGTDLEVEILLRSDGTPVWSGRASTVQMEGGPGDAPATVAAKLADALMRRFPAASGGAVSVP
jgi:hypothetical protein